MSCLGFKNLNVLGNMLKVPWSPRLIAVFKWLLVRYNADQILITSAWRMGDPGIHGVIPLRAIDIRSTGFNNAVDTVNDINDNFIYDPDRPEMKVAIYHNVGRGWHIHIQVHPKTMWINHEKQIGEKE